MCSKIALALFAALPLAAQTAANPAVDAIFAQFTSAGSPGCALGVYRDGKMLYAKGYGLANLESQVPITPASVFDIGSTSKQFTAGSILLLEKQGKLKLDDDIRKYLPELPVYPGPNGGTITILNLLNHTSGIRDYLTLFSLAGINMDGVTTEDTALAMLARQKALNFAPGSDYLYSNSGYFLLSVIVKRVSGHALREFAQDNIFQPLGMTHSAYRDDHRSLIPNRALAYEPAAAGFELDVSYFEQLGDGGVHTSVEDLLRWDENFYSGHVGGKGFLAEIQDPGKLSTGRVLQYAKGLQVSTYRGLRSVSHGGAWGGYRAELLRFPDEHFSVACLCNLGTADPSRLAKQTADVFLRSKMKGKATEPWSTPMETRSSSESATSVRNTKALDVYTGDYASDELGVIYRLAIANAQLTRVAILDSGGFPRNLEPAALRAAENDQFALAGSGIRLRFKMDANGRAVSFVANAGRTRELLFTRVVAAK